MNKKDSSKGEKIKQESKDEVKEEDKGEENTRKRKHDTRKKIKSRKRRFKQDTSQDDPSDIEKEYNELRLCLRIAPNEDKEVDYEILDKKYPIIDWKTENLGTKPQFDKSKRSEEINMNVVTRSNGQKRSFSTLIRVLSVFDREDLDAVYKLVMDIYQDKIPEGFDKVLWGDLIVMFNPDEQDEFWNSQHEWKVVSWKLHSSSGVHTLMTDEGLVVHMLIEKKYPLKKEILMQMLKLKLESEEESTMALELIRFIKKSWLVQDQTVLGKDYSNLLIADSLLKTIWFINAPCYDNEALASPNTNDEELSIPEQTATGKGTSNPLMAVVQIVLLVSLLLDTALTHSIHSLLFLTYSFVFIHLAIILYGCKDPFIITPSMEDEIYNLAVKGNVLKTYVRRFQKLAVLCPNMVPNTEKLMEVFIGGLPRSIEGNVTTSKPQTPEEAITITQRLMEQYFIKHNSAQETNVHKRNLR
ncbi:hypothetical protein Tco_1377290 [Tanacetum coccineum]